MILDIVKVFFPLTLAFAIGIALTPIITHFLYSRKMWKKKAGKRAPDGSETPIFNKLHEGREVGIPKMGGAIIWLSSLATILIMWLLAKLFPGDITNKLTFLSRNQTWIPLVTLLIGGIVGFIDDYLDVKGSGDYLAGGLSLKKRLAIVGGVALLVALWFYFKLGVSSVGFPFIGAFSVGWLIIPFFILVALAIYSGGVIDGVDGLAGGIFAIIFAAYTAIAFSQQQINLAAFCALLVGGILAFLWFNIPPARFYMSETGTMGLTVTLTVVAFMTDSLGGGHGVFVLPIIAMPLVFTTLSDIIQMMSKSLRRKKVFLVAPLHHHFEALGWPPYKVTMRYWVIGVVCAIVGMILALIG